MDEEIIILELEEPTESEVIIEGVEQPVEPKDHVEDIEVEGAEEVDVAVDEAIGWVSGDISMHSSLAGRDEPNQHEIKSITGLEDIISTLSSNKDIHSIHGGFAEFRKWLPATYNDTVSYTGGVGYFVGLVSDAQNNIYLDVCKKNTDVYGVTVDQSGFYGYQDVNYNVLDNDAPSRMDDPEYAKVCLLGNVKVRVIESDYTDIQLGDYVVPNELGCATKSDSNIGFKVISRGQIEGVGVNWFYVGIALVPQNDNVARVMKALQDTQGSLQNVTIKLGDVSNQLTGIENSHIQLGQDFIGLQDLVNESSNKIDTQLPAMVKMLEDAKDVASDAEEAIRIVQGEYTEAVSQAKKAQEAVNGVLSDVTKLQNDMKQLADWKGDDGSSGVVGFLAQAEKDHTELSSLTSAFGDNGADLTAIIQKIDENGAAIQHLVSHIDKYTLGEHSPAFGLSAEETYILNPGHIYVPTKDHRDEYTYVETPVAFKRGKYYEWAIGDTPEVYTWIERGDVSTSTSIIEGVGEGDLWYCWQGILDNDKYLYDPGVLYSWDNTKKIWVAVASVNNNATARVTGLVRQTAEKLTSAYTNLQGDVSELTQTANEISTIVASVQGNLSQIEQTAEDITLGVYAPAQGATSLEILLGGMENVSTYGGRICIKHVITQSPEIISDRYSQPPMWNGEEFVFAESALNSAAGTYYFGSDNHREYYKLVADGYEVYTIGHEVTTLLRTDVDANRASIDALTQFNTDTSETLASIQAQANENEAKIASVVAGEYVVCSYINLELATGDVDKILATTRYNNPPTWNGSRFIFNDEDKNDDGMYYQLDNDNLHYYKALFDDANIVGYEQYELGSTVSASIMQLVTEQGSSIGMIVDNNGVRGGVLVEAINEQLEATIQADKIKFDGYVTFANTEDLNQLKGEVIKAVEVQYAPSTSPTVAPTEGWSTTAPTWADGQYIWQKTVVTYASGTPSESSATCIQGAKGADGTGVAIKNTAYIKGSVSDDIVGQSFELYSDAACTSKITEISDGDAYLVGGYLFVYAGTDGKFVCVGKIRGPEGRGISTVEEYYLRNDSTTAPTWESTEWEPTLISPDASEKYLWNYEKIIYTDGAVEKTTPVIIATYVEDGVGVGSIKNYYLTSDQATGITIDDTRWQELPGVTDETNKYLWNYEEVYGTDGKVISATKPCVIGVHGERGVKGTDGAGINSVTVEYALSTSLDVPQDDGDDTVWKSSITELGEVGEENYVWTRTIIDYTDDREDTVTYTYSKQGKTGTAGTSVKVSTIEYCSSSSATIAPTEGWYLKVVDVPEGYYLWTKTTFTDGSKAYGVAKQGVSGRNGKDGTDGVGVSQVLTLYCLHPYRSTSPETPDIASEIWDTEQPAWESGQYIWICNQTTWTNDTITYTKPVLASALNSANETANHALDGIQGAISLANSIDLTLSDLCVTTDQTWIDGSKIYTGSIGANQIAAKAIGAEHIQAGAIVVGAVQTTEYVITSKTMDRSTAMQYYDGGLYWVSSEVLSKDDLLGAKVILEDGSEYTIEKVHTSTGFAYFWERFDDDGSIIAAIYSVFNGTSDIPCGVYFSDLTGPDVTELSKTKTLSDLLATENNTTVIDGGKIKTGSITADKITTGAITIGDVSVYEPITWNGNTEGLGSFTSKALAPDGTFYKISDQIPPIDSFKSATIVFNSGVKKSVLAVEDHETDDKTGEVVAYRVRWTTDSKNDSIVVQSQDGNYYQGLYMPKFNDGTYVAEIRFDDVLSGFFTTDSVSNLTVIDGGQIATGSITANQIAANALQSLGYEGPSTTSGGYATKGTFFNLSNGSITSKNFVIDASGNVKFRGTIDATGGTIGGFTIDEAIYYGKTSYNDWTSGVYIGADGIGLGAGAFYVTDAGYLYATNVKIAGNSQVGGCNITNGNLIVDSQHLGTVAIDKIATGDGFIRGYTGSTKTNDTNSGKTDSTATTGICMCTNDQMGRENPGIPRYDYVVAASNEGAALKVQYCNDTESRASMAVGIQEATNQSFAMITANIIKLNGYTLEFEKA